MIRRSSILAFLIALQGCAPKQAPVPEGGHPQIIALGLNDPMPVDPSITLGVLDNGLKYFIEPNAYPKDRVELRLVVKAGSLQEDPDQLGLAHLLEHMAFNGTTHFEAGELVEFLESTGVQFGAHLNAATGFESTTYMLTLPTNEEGLVDKGFLILQDWAQGMTLKSEEIEKERGVVLEEWRRSQGVGTRVSEQTLPLILGTDFASRLPIGTEESLNTFEHEPLERFYRDWYRPDLMAVVVVGDVEVDAMESRVRELFSGLNGPESPRTLIQGELPVHDEGAVLIITDPEIQSPSLEVNRTIPFEWGNDLEFMRGYIATTLASGMLNERIGYLARQDDSPILGAGGGTQVFNSYAQIQVLQIGVTEEKIESGLEAVLTEVRRAALHGFTEPEWQRALSQSRSRWETIRAEADNTESGTHAGEIVRHFLTDEYMPGTELEYHVVQRLMNEILTVEDANRAVRNFLTPHNRVLTLTLPEQEGGVAPTEAALKSLMAQVDVSTPEPPETEAEAVPLISGAPEPGSIVEESTVEALNLTTWTLSNGIQVHLKPTTLKEDEVLFRSYSWGGLSVLPDEDFVPGSTAVGLTSSSGLGAHDVDSLVRTLAGVTAGVSPSISSLSEGLYGNSAPRDLETLFQLIHLRVKEPRFDQDAYERMQTHQKTQLENRLVNPSARFSDMRMRLLLGDHLRVQAWTPDTLNLMDLTRSEAIYRERFADMSDHNFFFVGAFDLDEMRPLVETWIATLPVQEREETWKDVGLRYSEGVHEEVIFAGEEPKALVVIDYTGEFSFSRDTAHLMGAAAQALEQILLTRLREDLGGTYSVSVSSAADRIPVEDYNFTISFGCAPERVDELKAVVYAEIKRLQTELISAEEVSTLIETDLRALETNRQDNGYWLHILESYHKRGEDPLNHLVVEERYRGVTAEKVQQVFIEYFDSGRRIESVMMPEDYVP